MKLLTWNINGIRSLPENVSSTLNSLDADIVCFQETKITRDVLDSDVALVSGYNSYFSCTRKLRGGYSGVVTFCRDSCSPELAEQGLTSSYSNSDSLTNVGCYPESEISYDMLKSLDGEGRAVITAHRIICPENNETFLLSIINVYCPRADPDNDERWQYKMDFYRLLAARAKALQSAGHKVLIVGDFNIAHARLDHCDHESQTDFDTQEYRVWLTQLLTNPDAKFVDLFRKFNPKVDKAYTCWNTKLSAREINYGTRIDYILADISLVNEGAFENCNILPEIYGSDHCPVICTFKWNVTRALKCPDICSKYLPQFRGTQKKLFDFMVEKKFTSPAKKKPRPAQKSLTDFVTVAPKTNSNNVPKKASELAEISTRSSQESKSDSDCSSNAWKHIFKGPPKAPLCKGHNEECVLRTVKKSGPNQNRQFFVCRRPEGHKSDKNARCDHFEWVKRK